MSAGAVGHLRGVCGGAGPRLDVHPGLSARRVRTLWAAGTISGICLANCQPQRTGPQCAAPATSPGRRPVSGYNGRPGFTDRLAGVAADGGPEADNIEESGLDVRTHALVRLAAVVASGE